MGTARREIYTLSPGFSRASESSPDAARTATLSKARAPLSGRTHSRAPCPSQRKENSPRGSRPLLRDLLRYRTGRLAAPISALRIRGSEPDSLSIGWGQRRPSPVPSQRRSPISQDRLTHVQLLFTNSYFLKLHSEVFRGDVFCLKLLLRHFSTQKIKIWQKTTNCWIWALGMWLFTVLLSVFRKFW